MFSSVTFKLGKKLTLCLGSYVFMDFQACMHSWFDFFSFHTHEHTSTHMNTHPHTCTHTCMHTHILLAHVHITHTHTCMYTHNYAHTYIPLTPTHTHTYMYMHSYSM